MAVYDWQSVPHEQLNPKLSRQVIHTENMTIARLALAAGAVVPQHHHTNEQVTLVEKGTLKFVFPTEEKTVGPGECMQIPPSLPHSVEVIEDAIVTDLFSPRREDWLRGDDAYLRK